MKRLLARFLSYLFHPVLFFLVMPFFVVYKQTDSGLYAAKWMFFSSIFIFIGIMLILFEMLRGDFSDFDISKKEQRTKFFIILFFLGVIYLAIAMYFKGIFFPLSFISLGIAFGVVLFALVNRLIKASIHVAVSSGFVVSMYLLFGEEMFLLTLWIVPVVGWARVLLKRHSIGEVISGGLLGTAITMVTFIVGEYFYNIRLLGSI